MAVSTNSRFLKLYGGYELTLGDSDKKKRWGGKARLGGASNFVTQLQKDLVAVGVLDVGVDGAFGRNTMMAVKRFQWNVLNVNYRIRSVPPYLLGSGRLEKAPALVRNLRVTGVVDKATAQEIQFWNSQFYYATGDLVKVDTLSLSNIKLTKSLNTKFSNFALTQTEFVVSEGYLKAVNWMNAAASANSLTVSVNHTFRLNGVKVVGAIVKPASKSQHLIGHAIDCNLITKDGDWNSSKTFKSKKEHADTTAFIKAVKLKGLRWGGDFGGGIRTSSQFDPIHFDLEINWRLEEFGFKFYFNQRTHDLRQPIATAILAGK